MIPSLLRKSKNDCDWMAKNTNKCKKKGLDKVKGRDACPVACDECPEEEVCEDSTSWFRKKSKYDCAWVAESPSKRCEKDDEHGIDAEDACLVSCGVCEAPAPTPNPSREPTAKPTSAPTSKPTSAPIVATPVPTVGTVESGCEDSVSWFSGNPEKGCAGVAESLGRCDSKEDDHGVLANEACKATCGTCPTTPTCENSASWFYKGEARLRLGRDQAGVRCAKEDDEDVSAHEACTLVCDASCVVADSTWYYGKPSRIATTSRRRRRCSSKKDDDGISHGHAVACADAGEQDRKPAAQLEPEPTPALRPATA
ncbi:cupin-like domain-containing protein [Aureococcus anophagefferens]|nr:cupin-like domain-containing protein [Aureococcus anophagefferens]